jgi:GTP cyclohydrolase II
MNLPQEMLKQLLAGGLGLYDHQAEGSNKYYLFAMSDVANDESLNTLLTSGKQLQAFVNTEAWGKGEGPSSDVHGLGKVVRLDSTIEGLRTLDQKIQNWDLSKSDGWDRIVIRSFPLGDVLIHGGPEAFLLEALSHSTKDAKCLFVAELNSQQLAELKETQGVWCEQHKTILITRQQVIDSRIENPRLVRHTGVIPSPLRAGDFKVHSFYSALDRCYHWAFATDDLKDKISKSNEVPLIRIESECLTGHVFGSLLCDCGKQMEQGLEKVQASGLGALIYLRQEGRGIGLVNKLKAYRLQQQESMDTVDANLAIGVPEDARDYLIGALMLKSFGITKVRLITNNPAKVTGLEKYGIEVTERVSHVIPPSEHNAKYLSTKKQRMGHLI